LCCENAPDAPGSLPSAVPNAHTRLVDSHSHDR
jgi:hypothetical protein